MGVTSHETIATEGLSIRRRSPYRGHGTTFFGIAEVISTLR